MAKELELYTLPPSDLSLTEQDIRAIISNTLTNFSEIARVQKGSLESGNFVTGTTGWKVDALGNLEANSGNFRGTITATTGTIGGFSIGADFVRDAANSMGLASTVTGGDDVRFWAGNTFANRAAAAFRVTEAGVLVATSATITGTITAAAGTIGGFAIAATTISATNLVLTSGAANVANITVGTGATAAGLNSANVSGDISIWSGATFANRAAAPFRVTAGGALTTTNIILTGLQAGSAIDGQFLTALSVATAAVAANAITTAKIAALAVTSAELAAASVTTAKIAALAVTTAELGAAAVTTAKIAALAVTSSELAAASVTTAKIAALAVTTSELGALAVTTAKIAADAITASEIAASAVGSSELAAGAVIAGKITAGTIVAADIAASTITGAKIAATTITAANIAALTITAAEIAASTITGAKIAATTITAANIAALTITASEIAAATITGAKIAATTITAANIAALTITASEIAAATITGAKIAANTITAANITALTITAAEIAANTITAAKIAALTITASEIAANTITAAKIVAGTITTTEIAATTITGANINTLNIAGKNATFDTGTIGGFAMAATTLSATNFLVTSGAANTANLTVGTGATAGGLNSAAASGDIAIWAGSTFANRAAAAFRVTAGGAVTMTSATISGFKLFEAVVDAAGGGDFLTIAAAFAAGAKRIFVRKGTYNTAASISIPLLDDISIVGESLEAIIFITNASNINAFTMAAGAGTRARFYMSNITIDGNRDNQASGGCFLGTAEAPNLILDRVQIKNGKDRGVELLSNVALITNCFFDNNSKALILDNTVFHKIINNSFGTVSANTTSSIQIKNAATQGNSIVIADNIITGDVSIGIDLSKAGFNTIENNYFSGCSDAIFMASTTKNNIVVGNMIRNNTDNGVDMADTATDKNLVVGNIFFSNTNGDISDGGTSNYAMDNSPNTLEQQKRYVLMKNVSGGTLNAGDVVIFTTNATLGFECTTTTTGGSNRVFGVMEETTGNNSFGMVQTLGKCKKIKVDGTTDIAVGDLLSTFTTAKIAKKASAGENAFAIAYEAYTPNDSNGVITGLLINPRVV